MLNQIVPKWLVVLLVNATCFILVMLNIESEQPQVTKSLGIIEQSTATPLRNLSFEKIQVLEDGVIVDSNRAEVTTLLANGNHLLFVKNNRLIVHDVNGQETVLDVWDRAEKFAVWRNGSVLLLGIDLIAQPNKSEEEQMINGEWIVLDVPENSSMMPSIKHRELFFFGPTRVIDVRASLEPNVVKLTFRTFTGDSSDYIYAKKRSSSDSVFLTLNSFIDPREQEGFVWPNGKSRGPVVKSRPFDQVRKFSLPSGDGYCLKDELGCIVYGENGISALWRYVNIEPLGMQVIARHDGGNMLLGHYQTKDQREFYHFPDYGYDQEFAFQPRLMEAGWYYVGSNYFYRVHSDFIEITDKSGEYQVYRTDAKSLSRNGNWLEWSEDSGDQKKVKRVLLNDVIYDRTSVNQKEGQLASYALKRANEINTHIFATQDPSIIRQAQQQLQKNGIDSGGIQTVWKEVVRKLPSDEPFVEQLYPKWNEDAKFWTCVNDMDSEGSGDYSYHTIGKDADELNRGNATKVSESYFLLNESLYSCKNGKYKFIKDLPLTIKVVAADYGEPLGPKDFIRLSSGEWLFADTDADRLVKFDQKFNEIASVPIKHPLRLQEQKDGSILVNAFLGRQRLSSDLKPVGDPVPNEMTVSKKTFVDYTFTNSNEILVDEKNNAVWWVTYQKIIYWNQKTNGLRIYPLHLGRSGNGLKLFREDGDNIYYSTDVGTEVFDRKGNWITRFDHPRSENEAVYSQQPSGEGSWIWDQKQAKLYFVQGFRVVELDMRKRAYRVLFDQWETNIGPLHWENGRLIFSMKQLDLMNYGGTQMDEEKLVEWVSLDVRLGDALRYAAE